MQPRWKLEQPTSHSSDLMTLRARDWLLTVHRKGTLIDQAVIRSDGKGSPILSDKRESI